VGWQPAYFSRATECVTSPMGKRSSPEQSGESTEGNTRERERGRVSMRPKWYSAREECRRGPSGTRLRCMSVGRVFLVARQAISCILFRQRWFEKVCGKRSKFSLASADLNMWKPLESERLAFYEYDGKRQCRNNTHVDTANHKVQTGPTSFFARQATL